MSSTPIEYAGRSFEANDAFMAVWLHLVIDEINGLSECPPWLDEIRNEWVIQSSAGLGYVDPGLDQCIATADQRDIVVAVSESALRKLKGHAELMSVDELNSMGTGGEGSFFTGDIPTELIARHGAFFIKLLKNELEQDEIDARISE